MNIFYSDICAVKCAQNLDDKRLIKMVLETAQLLSTSINVVSGETSSAIYKSTHVNHPCSIWTRGGSKNYQWLYKHFNALLDEYTYRFNKTHKCGGLNELLGWGVALLNQRLPDIDFSAPPNCTRNQEKHIDFKYMTDTVAAYQAYLNARWKTDKRVPIWTNRTKPDWFKAF